MAAGLLIGAHLHKAQDSRAGREAREGEEKGTDRTVPAAEKASKEGLVGGVVG